MNLGALTAYLTVNTTAFKKGMMSAQMNMVSAGKKMNMIGKSLSMGLSLPLIAIGGYAAKMATEFEASMSKITGLVGIGEDVVAGWGESIKSLVPVVGISATKLADAMYFIASAGLRGQDALDALTVSARASAAGLGETTVIADLVTSAMNAYGSDILGAAKATDILVASVREGKADAPAFASAMGAILPIASSMGVQFDEVGAAIAAMTRTGTDANTAATQLKGILASLLKPTEEAEKALIGMGTSSAQLRDDLKNKGLLSVLQELSEKTDGDAAAMSEILPNIRALSGMLDLMGGNAEDNIAIFKSLEDTTGSLDKAFAAAEQTTKLKFNKSIEGLKASLLGIGDSVKEGVLPMLEWLGNTLKSVGEWFNSLSSTGKSFVTTLGAIAIGLGPVLMILGKMLTILPILKTKIIGFTKFLATNPYLALAAAVAFLVMGFLNMRKEMGRLDKALDDAKKKIVTEQIGLNALFTQLKKTNKGTSERKKLINEINTKYGEYLPRLLTEKDSLKAIEMAQRQANNEIVRSILLKAKEAEIADQLTDITENQVDSIKEINDAMTKANIPIDIAAQAIAEFTNKMRDAEGLDYVDAVVKQAEVLRDALIDLGITYDLATQAAFSSTGGTNKLTSALWGESIVIAEVSRGFDALLKSQGAADGNSAKVAKRRAIRATQLKKLTDKQDEANRKATEAQQELDDVTKAYNESMKAASAEYEYQLTLIGQMPAGLRKEIALLEAKQQKLQAEADAYKTLANIDKFYSDSEKAKIVQLNTVLNDTQKELNAIKEKMAFESIDADFKFNMQIAGGDPIVEQEALISSLRNRLNVIEELARAEGEATQEQLANIASLKLAIKEQTDNKISDTISGVEAVKEGLLTEEEAIRQSYAKQIAIIEQGMAIGIIAASDAYATISELLDAMDAELFANNGSVNNWASNWEQAASSIEDAVRAMAIDTAVSLIQMAVSMKGSAAIGASILNGFADMMIQVGKIAIGVGMAAMGIKEALKNLRWEVALAAGVALVALGTVAKNSLATIGSGGTPQGLATGTDMVTKGGVFRVGEKGTEDVILPKGSAVIPHGGLSDQQGAAEREIISRIKGRDLEIILQRATSQSNLRRG